MCWRRRRFFCISPAALANAATTVGAVTYLICAALALVAPDLLLGLFQTWAHGISVAALRPANPGFGAGAFAIGLVVSIPFMSEKFFTGPLASWFSGADFGYFIGFLVASLTHEA